jgi:pseudouridine-5'-phosphate glycosidase
MVGKSEDKTAALKEGMKGKQTVGLMAAKLERLREFRSVARLVGSRELSSVVSKGFGLVESLGYWLGTKSGHP